MADYVTDAVLKMQRELIKTMEPTQEAADDFDEYVQVCTSLLCSSLLSNMFIVAP